MHNRIQGDSRSLRTRQCGKANSAAGASSCITVCKAMAAAYGQGNTEKLIAPQARNHA